MVKVPEVAGLELTDLFLAGASKVIGEKVIGSFAGNGTVKSALVKGGVALAVPFVLKGKMGKNVALGLGVDAMEDIVFGFNVGNFFNASEPISRV